MPGNTVKINNFDGLEWYVGDSKMDQLIAFLDGIGIREKQSQDENPEHLEIAKHILTEVAEEILVTEFKNRPEVVSEFANRIHDYLLKMADSDKGATQFLPKPKEVSKT